MRAIAGKMYYIMLSFCCALVLCASPVFADNMPGMGGGSSEPQKEGNVPDDIEAIVGAFLDAIPAGQTVPSPEAIKALVDFTLASDNPKRVQPAPRPHGKGAFVRQLLNVPLADVLRYCFNPAIPGEAVYPSSISYSYWTPQSQIVTQDIKLWEKLALPADQKPIVLRGQEFEEITPDSFSNCYYNYTLNRLLVLTTIEGRNVMISVSKQNGPSSVGKVGSILGKDESWHYLYSAEVGSNLSLARWAETYMYDSANLTIFFEPTPGSKTTEMAFFKYVRAGWANMNMVKPTHIYDGSQRYLNGLRQILESPNRLTAEQIAGKKLELKGLQTDALRSQLVPYSAALVPWATAKSSIANKDFKALLGAEQYVLSLSPEQMRGELLKQFLNKSLQKSVFATAKE